MRFAHSLCLALCWLSAVDSAKILVFICQVNKSHHLVFHPIIRELAARGHEVDYYTHHPLDNPPKTLNQIPFPLMDAIEVYKILEYVDMRWFRSLFLTSFMMRMAKFSSLMSECYDSVQVKELLASNKSYDLVMGEFPFGQEEFSYFAHKFKALGVLMQSLPDYHWMNELSGLPCNPAYMVPITTHLSDKMSFFERLTNFCAIELTTLLEYISVSVVSQRIADNHLKYDGWESRPPVMKMVSDMALILVSGHHSFGYAFPTAPHLKQVLGTNVDENPPPLPKDLQEFMDSAEHGVVYFSFGTIVSVEVLKAYKGYDTVLKILSGLKQKVLWKWTSYSKEEPPQVPNIKFLKWMPQQSILAHNKTKLFMTHGGLGGLTEAVYHGIPMIGFPVFGDQLKNVRLLTDLGIGITIDFDNITDASLKWATSEILDNPMYKQNILKRSMLYKDRPMKPVDEAVYWIEYVLRHGKVLQPAAAQMPFYQLYLLDIIGFLCICAAVFIYVSIRLLKLVRRALNRVGNTSKTTTEGTTLESKKRK